MAEIVDFGLQQHKIKMDSRYFENVLSVVAGDTGRRLEVQLLDTNGMVQDTTGLKLRLNAMIAGKATFTDATLVDAATGKYQLDLSNGMFLAPGNWQFQWQIIDSAGKKLHSFAFTGNVGSNISEGGSQATNFYLNLEDLKKMQDDLINGTIDSSILETNIAEKLTDLETQYAPKLTEVTTQLAQIITVDVKSFGAKGDGVTNDTLAFQKVSDKINALGGGKINIPKGTYVVGGQTFAGEAGKGYSYKSDPILNLINCDYVEIIGNDSKLITQSGLKYGSFDPITGSPHNQALPFWNADYGADVGTHIHAEKIKDLIISNIELDGNDVNMIIGGNFGDSGRQNRANGLRLINIEKTNLTNVDSHHHLLDGIATMYRGLTKKSPKKPVIMINCSFEYNGRQGLSWSGGKGLTAINSKFNHTGKSTINSGPGAGLDVEAEGGVARDGLFINCEFANNTGPSITASSGDNADVSFYKCNIFGTTNHALWVFMPRFKFYECTISGGIIRPYLATKKEDRTLFRDCLITSKEAFEDYPVNGTRLADLTTGNPIFDNSVFTTDKLEISLPFSTKETTYRDCYFEQDVYVGNSNTRGTFEGVNKFNILTGELNLYDSIITGIVDSNVPISGASRDNDGRVLKNNEGAKSFVKFNGPTFTTENQDNTVRFRVSKPVSGTFKSGDVVFNNKPVAGSFAGWICTVAGTPGTWKGFGTIES